MTSSEKGPRPVRRTGRIVERHIGGQSKQSRKAPVLETPDGDVHIHVLGDNPFAPALLVSWMGQHVEVTGQWRGHTLRVAAADIRALEDDALSGSSADEVYETVPGETLEGEAALTASSSEPDEGDTVRPVSDREAP